MSRHLVYLCHECGDTLSLITQFYLNQNHSQLDTDIFPRHKSLYFALVLYTVSRDVTFCPPNWAISAPNGKNLGLFKINEQTTDHKSHIFPICCQSGLIWRQICHPCCHLTQTLHGWQTGQNSTRLETDGTNMGRFKFRMSVQFGSPNQNAPISWS